MRRKAEKVYMKSPLLTVLENCITSNEWLHNLVERF